MIRFNNKKKKTLLSILVTILIIDVIAAAYLFLNFFETYKLKENCTYFINGIDYPISEGTEVSVSRKSEVLIIKNGNEEIETNSLPIYMDGTDGIVLTRKMLYVYPKDDIMKLNTLNYYTEVSFDKTISVLRIDNGNKKKDANCGFLYDGSNTYIFMNDTVLMYNDKVIELGRFSYLVVNYNETVEFYNTKNNQYIYENFDGDVNVYDTANGYSVNLNNDTCLYKGSEMILFGKISSRKNFLEEK